MNYKFDTIVNKSEADALKQMIFNRAKERAKDVSEDVQFEIMDNARDAFVSKNNPFSAIVDKAQEETKIEKITENPETGTNTGIGFSVKKPDLNQINSQTKIIKEQIASATIQNNMQSARAELSQRQGFMGALEFLNAKAAVSLIRTRADKFEMLV